MDGVAGGLLPCVELFSRALVLARGTRVLRVVFAAAETW